MRSDRSASALSLLLFGSGCAALIYEVVWFQLLQLVVGSSAVSLGVLLGTFMGGMCLGSLALPVLVSARAHPLRVYAWIELGIGGLGLIELWLVPMVARVYVAGAGDGFPGLLMRGLVGGVCLLPPTVLMGATLPATARWVEATPRGAGWLGVFYGANLTGSVLGCGLAGFYLLPTHDVATATYVAASINGIVAAAALGLAAFTQYSGRTDAAASTPPLGQRPGAVVVYVTIGLSGLCALAGEVVWTRLLSLILGPTVYTFSILVAVFLIGLGLGAVTGSLLARWLTCPRVALGACQMLLTGAAAWTAWMIARSLPYWPIDPALTRSPWLNFQLDLVRCLWALLPAACLWGASFPLALAAISGRGEDPGRWAGRVYAANTVGAILGAVGFSLGIIPWLGTRGAEQLVIGLSGLAGICMWAPALWRGRLTGRPRGGWAGIAVGFARRLCLLPVAGLAAGLAWTVPSLPGGLVAYGRYVPRKEGEGKILYVGEGMNASVAVTELRDGVRNFHIGGKIEASSEGQDMRLQRLLAHLPTLLHPHPRSALVVGCGAGVTAGSVLVHPEVKRMVICELEPLVPRVVAGYFQKQNYHVVDNPRAELVYDDARHYLLVTREKFDVITSDPIHPWVRGAAALYTREYFELVKRHLNPGGLVTQWVPLYESNLQAVKSEIATFLEVFPQGTIWSNDLHGEGYDLVLLGQVEPTPINLDALEQRLRRNEGVAESLREVGFPSVVSLLGTYAGRGPELREWLAGAEINRDRNLRLQYLAGLELNLYESGLIYDDLLRHRRFPENLFTGSSRNKGLLRLLLRPPEPK